MPCHVSIHCMHAAWASVCMWCLHIWYHSSTISVWKLCSSSPSHHAPRVMELSRVENSWNSHFPFIAGWLTLNHIIVIGANYRLSAQAVWNFDQNATDIPKQLIVRMISWYDVWTIFSVRLWFVIIFAVVFSNTGLSNATNLDRFKVGIVKIHSPH